MVIFMGNSMLRPLKTKSNFMREQLGDKLGDDFEKNKKTISSLKLPLSKKTRNRMAGYIVRETNKANKKKSEQ